jgi:hypothetical protein
MEEQRKAVGSKPLQLVSWTEKIAHDYQFFKDTADFYINQGISGRNSINGGYKQDLKIQYDVYNNRIPTAWFNHITDPLSAKLPQHKQFPAKVRPTNILRTNIDLLLSEWLRRPFKYHTENLGESGYNSYIEGLDNALHESIQKLFVANATQAMVAQGADPEQINAIDPASVPIPADIKEQYQASYKDKQAIKGQKWLTRAIREYSIKRNLHKLFKDWLLAGEAGSYKGIHNGELIYKRLSPLYLNYDKSPDIDFVEDGEWATYVHYLTSSDIVDLFYKDLKYQDLKRMELMSATASPSAFYSFLEGLYTTEERNKIPVYQVVWKGKKRVLFFTYTDPLTGETQSDYADEAERQSLIDQFGPNIKIEEEWHNEVYETWRIASDIYVRMQPVPHQRNSMNNMSRTKLPINAKKYSDTHSPNISVAQIGIPYLIMYIIVTRALELTIAKNKGKILMIDNNAIPRTKGWDEEKFFYYSEALGYGLLDRNQIGVDHQWNQYHVVDMSLFEQIEQLINLQTHFKQEWDDALGINRQRKGQTFASEPNAAIENTVFQSSVITDMIFIGFDEFVEKELQGLLDLSKFTNIDGVRRLYNGDLMTDTLLEIDPNEYTNAELGVFIVDGLEDSQALNPMKAQAAQFIQNGVRPSTILEIYQEGNIASLHTKLKAIEAIEDEQARAEQENEVKAQADADERKMKFMEYEKILEEQLINVEYDRKEDLEAVVGQLEALSFAYQKSGDGASVIADSNEVIKQETAREKILSDERKQVRELDLQERIAKLKEVLSSHNKQADRESNERIADKQIKAKLQGDRLKARTKTKNSK